MDKSKENELRRTATDIRIGIVDAVYSAQSGHPGGSLSIADIMTYLYFEEMNVDPTNPKAEGRDRFVLSKGHTSPALYSTLANRGYFPVEDLKTFRHLGSYLQGHPDMKGIPGVDMSSGSLGQGLSVACGMALAGKMKGASYRVFAVVGDGEAEEGQIWAAIMFAAHYKLSNLTLIIDQNGLQIDGKTSDVMNTSPLDEKLKAFGWDVTNLENAHDFNEIESVFASRHGVVSDKPYAIIAHSHKGHGVSYMEDQAGWHGKAPNEEQYKQAIAELTAYRESI
ncbi:MAG: transketolase [Firmicutes bacterium]|nr:transketolase [Bacillota bacterium]